MARTPDPSRKPALLAEIVDHLLDKPLATVSFRTVATALGVSTYSLVYHFGNREQLMNDIIGSVMERQDIITAAVRAEGGDIEDHLENLRRSWQISLTPRSRSLMRLEFEGAMLRAQNAVSGYSGIGFARWFEGRVEALELMGIAPADAEIEARMIVDMMYGLQYDLLVTRDEERSTAAFTRTVDAYEQRIRALISGAEKPKDESAGESTGKPGAHRSENSSDVRMSPWPAR